MGLDSVYYENGRAKQVIEKTVYNKFKICGGQCR
jgi:hypothetical protein